MAGSRQLKGVDLTLLPPNECSLATLDRTLAELASATPGITDFLLHGCAACISADHEVSVTEGETLRAIADALECPVPPLLPGQPLA